MLLSKTFAYHAPIADRRLIGNNFRTLTDWSIWFCSLVVRTSDFDLFRGEKEKIPRTWVRVPAGPFFAFSDRFLVQNDYIRV